MKTRTILHVALAAILVGGGWLGWSILHSSDSSSTVTTSVVTASKGTVLSSVSATGNIASTSTSSLTFASPGSAVVTSISVGVGDHVAAGEELARLDDTDAKRSLNAAQASVDSAQKAYDQLLAGETPKQRQADAVSLEQARNSVSQAQTSYSSTVTSTSQDLTTAQTQLDQARSNLSDDQASLAAAQQQLATDEAAGKPQLTLTADQSQIDSLTSKVKADQNAVANSQNSYNSTKIKAQQSLTTAKNQVDSAGIGLQSSSASVAVKQDAPTPDKIAQSQAQLVSAQNSLANAQKVEAETVLKAPADGTVAAVNGQVGSTASGSSSGSSASSSSSGASASAGSGGSSSTGGSGSGSGSTGSSSSAFITLVDLTHYEVKVGFSEADAARVKVGEAATVTLDAVTGETYSGKVTQLDVTSTLVSNVVTYYAMVRLDDSAAIAKIKPGMTAQVTIVVEKADDAVTVPSTAISSRGTSANVTVQNAAGKKVQRTLTIGLRGDQSIQITSGLAAGEKIVVSTTTSTGGAAGASGLGGAGGFGGGGVPGGGGGLPGGGAGPVRAGG